MSAIRVSEFRQITGISESVIPNEKVSLALKIATGIASDVTSRKFGHAIELIRQDGSDAILTMCGHGLPETGKVFVKGTGVSALNGELSYVAIDSNQIRIAGVSLSGSVVNKGNVGVPITTQCKVIDRTASLNPGPVCFISEVRSRADSSSIQFDDASIMDASGWYIDLSTPKLNAELELNRDISVYRRVPGLMIPVRQRVTKELLVSYYAGFVTGVPFDLQAAIAAMASELTSGNALVGGYVSSESFEDYTYSTGDIASLKQIPTSAISTLMRYSVSV